MPLCFAVRRVILVLVKSVSLFQLQALCRIQTVGLFVNDEMERMLKEAAVAYCKVLLPDFREVIEKITKKLRPEKPISGPRIERETFRIQRFDHSTTLFWW
jgi:hypothetical protein